MNKPLKVFITYSHKDGEAKGELVTRLSVMVQNSLIEIWHDNEILPGDKWREVISNNLQSSDILLYIVSATSLASKNCNKELADALEKTNPRIVPIILEACDWLEHRISNFQALPDFGKPIPNWEPESDGWQNVVQGIRKVVDDMLTSVHPPPETKPEKPDREDTVERLQFANVLVMLGQFDKAVGVYSKIIQLDPNTDAYTGRGVAKGSLEQHEEAMADFDAALRLSPQNAAAYAGRGITKGKLGQYEAAIAAFDNILRLNPQDVFAYTHIGLAKVSLGQYEAAIEDFNTAIVLNPQYAAAYHDRGLAKGHLGQHEAAIMDFNMTIALDSQYATAYCNRGFTKASLGQHEAAIMDFDTAIVLNPHYATAYYNRGLAKGSLGQHEAAIMDFDTAIVLNPQDAEAYHDRGRAKGNLGRYEAAIADFDTAISLNSQLAIAYYNRGISKNSLEQYEEAAADLQHTLKLAAEQANEELAQFAQKVLNEIPSGNSHESEK